MTLQDAAPAVLLVVGAVLTIAGTVAFIRHLTADDRRYRNSLRKERHP